MATDASETKEPYIPSWDHFCFRFCVNPKFMPRDYRIYCERIARILTADGQLFENVAEQKFQIGTGNDYWIRRGKQHNELVVSCRYPNQKKMGILLKAIIILLDLEPYNQIEI
ncbi:MAG: hypothetical protein WC668_01720 [Patescibacteria group bacterium]|jgi:hypothetical protein